MSNLCKYILIFLMIIIYPEVFAVECVHVKDEGINAAGPIGERGVIGEYIPARSKMKIYYTNWGVTIKGYWIECTNLTGEGVNVDVKVPKRIKFQKEPDGEFSYEEVSDLRQETAVSLDDNDSEKDDNFYDELGEASYTGILQIAAFESGDMQLLVDFVRENLHNKIYIPDFSRDLLSPILDAPLYYCVDLNKLKDKEISISLSDLGTSYSVENGKIVERLSGSGPDVEKLEDFYISEIPCELDNLGSEVEGWTTLSPFSGTTSLFTYHWLIVELEEFKVTAQKDNILLEWVTASELKNAGFRIWRAIDNGLSDGYSEISVMRNFAGNKLRAGPVVDKLDKLIPAKGSERKRTSYTYVDNSIHGKNVTSYYLIEDLDFNGQSTFHCNKIFAVVIGEGPVIDLESARKHCRNMCDELGNVICD